MNSVVKTAVTANPAAPTIGVVIVLFGSITLSGELNKKSLRMCECAAGEYHARTKTRNHLQGGKLVKTTSEIPAAIILASRDRRKQARQHAVDRMARCLVSCWWISPGDIIKVYGRRFLDIAHKVAHPDLRQRDLVVIGESPSFPKLNLFEFRLRRSGIKRLEYVDPANTFRRRRDDRKDI